MNPDVEVPDRVARAFAARARSGRIFAEGALETVPIRATLVPASGGHRLFVNGGMRAAAGVGVGDAWSCGRSRRKPPERGRISEGGAAATCRPARDLGRPALAEPFAAEEGRLRPPEESGLTRGVMWIIIRCSE